MIDFYFYNIKKVSNGTKKICIFAFWKKTIHITNQHRRA